MAIAKKSAKKSKKSAAPAKKSSKASAKNVAKRASSARPAAKKSKSERPSLTDEAKSRLLKPPTDYLSLVERSLTQWNEHKSTLKLANSSPAKLRAMLSAARKARAKEEDLRAQFEKRLAPLADARMVADDAVWRQTLDLFALAKAQGRVLPQLVEAFSFLADVFKRSAKESEEPKPTEGAGSGATGAGPAGRTGAGSAGVAGSTGDGSAGVVGLADDAPAVAEGSCVALGLAGGAGIATSAGGTTTARLVSSVAGLRGSSVHRRSGSFRMVAGTAGFGASRATISSIPCLDLPAASSRIAAQFSAVRCGARSRRPVR